MHFFSFVLSTITLLYLVIASYYFSDRIESVHRDVRFASAKLSIYLDKQEKNKHSVGEMLDDIIETHK